MRVLVAMDSFKGTFTSLEAAHIVEKGIKKVYKNADVEKVVIADGGEGTVEAIVESLKGEYLYKKVTGPLGDIVNARYGIVHDNTAIIEMAEASGLSLVSAVKRNPLLTTSYGTGELIKDALDHGCRKIILGIGGSATVDGGAGLALALGARLFDKDKNIIEQGGGSLGKIDKIDLSNIDSRILDSELKVACDVNNPLCGENGAANIFGPQKGATPERIETLNANLMHFSIIINKEFKQDLKDVPGIGAAGGLGLSLIAFFKAKLVKGIDTVLDIVRIEERIKNADVVITGEGRIDKQTVCGKVPVGIASRTKKYNKPVFAITGYIEEGAESIIYEHGIEAIMSSVVAPMELEEVLRNSSRLIENASERLFRIINAASKI